MMQEVLPLVEIRDWPREEEVRVRRKRKTGVKHTNYCDAAVFVNLLQSLRVVRCCFSSPCSRGGPPRSHAEVPSAPGNEGKEGIN